MTLPMLETLRTETAAIHLSLLHCDDSGSLENLTLIPYRNGRSFPTANDFLYLRVKVTNLSRKFQAIDNFDLPYLAHEYCSVLSHV